MSHNEEHTRCQLIGACSASASRAMDAAATAVAWPAGQDPDSEVEVHSGTRIAERIPAGDRDQQAGEVIAEIRQRLDRLEGLYPCEGRGRGLSAVEALENE